MMLLMSLFLSSSLWAQNISFVRENNNGVDAIVDSDLARAQSHFLKAMQDKKVSPTARLNLGLTFEINKQPTEAIKEYTAIIKNEKSSPDLKYSAYYNMGRVYQLLNKKDDALNHYQSALSIKPNSYEVKHNIELMTQQGGGGQGKGENKDDGGKGDDPNQAPQDTDPEKQKQEAAAKPKELSEKDMKKILEELKNQEQEIRAKELGNNVERGANEKDW